MMERPAANLVHGIHPLFLPEILDIIFRECFATEDYDTRVLLQGRSSFYSYVLVNKLWCSCAVPYLWKEISFNNYSDLNKFETSLWHSIRHMTRGLDACITLLQTVKFSFSVIPRSLLTLLSLSPHLQALHFYECDLVNVKGDLFFRHFIKLRTLTLWFCTNMHDMLFYRCYNLEELSLNLYSYCGEVISMTQLDTCQNL